MRLFKVAFILALKIFIIQSSLVFGVEEKLQSLTQEDQAAPNFFQNNDFGREIFKKWVHLVTTGQQLSPYTPRSELKEFGPLLLTSKNSMNGYFQH